MIDFVVQMSVFKLRLEVDTVVVLGTKPVFGLVPILAHHDDGGLKRRQAGQHQIEQNAHRRFQS